MTKAQQTPGGERPSLPAGDDPRGGVRLASAVIAAAVVLVYANSLQGPFILDDLPNIAENPAIRSLWPPGDLFASPPTGVAGRPLVTLTLALSHAISGQAVWSYHALNALIHLLAAWTLMGVLRRTLWMPSLREAYGRWATPLAAVGALLWAVHPLQTQAVTYIIQRCESLMGLFFLLTFYGALRGWQSPHRRRWHGLAIAACLAGVGSKEVIAAAPVLVLLYDRMFVHAKLGDALKRSALLYVGLLGCWIVLGGLVLSAGVGALGLERLNVTPLQYAVTQPGVILHYLRLAVWPAPLVLDYQWPIAQPREAILPGLVVLLLAGATLWALLRGKPVGFLGAWFFVILAPTSSIIPIRDLAFEQRMYLPLAAVTTLAVLGAYRLGQRWTWSAPRPGRLGRLAGTLALAAVVGALAYGTIRRNRDYRSELSIWTDTVAKRPLNAGAHQNLGVALLAVGRTQDALQHTERALRLNPGSAQVRNNLGALLAERGQLETAKRYLAEAVALDPGYAEAHYNLANVLWSMGRADEAADHYRQALRHRDRYPAAARNLGQALRMAGRVDEAVEAYRRLIALTPRDAQAHQALAHALLGSGRLNEALASYREALRLDPDDLGSRNGVAWILATHPDPAARDARAAIAMAEENVRRAEHGSPGLLDTLAAAYAAAGRFEDAIAVAERALAMAGAGGAPGAASGIRQRLARYRNGQPFECATR